MSTPNVCHDAYCTPVRGKRLNSNHPVRLIVYVLVTVADISFLWLDVCWMKFVSFEYVELELSVDVINNV